jgi:F0F1-type ATP synthase membrane subunit c/vacuolar-type H+-ATPase subunit K
MPAIGIASNLVLQLPVTMVWGVAIVLAVVRWRRHPTVSLLVMVAALLYGLAALGSSIGHRWAFVALFRMGAPIPRYLVGWAIGMGLASLRALAWGLLFAAVFGWRDGER